ncbi:hypothetical protein [Microvirga sp. TS319]|uniref:hypothetical protein n=1 Tax=Microvirga sp. TS319 TaxID=3241165 RepID=UPI00351A1A6F
MGQIELADPASLGRAVLHMPLIVQDCEDSESSDSAVAEKLGTEDRGLNRRTCILTSCRYSKRHCLNPLFSPQKRRACMTDA